MLIKNVWLENIYFKCKQNIYNRDTTSTIEDMGAVGSSFQNQVYVPNDLMRKLSFFSCCCMDIIHNFLNFLVCIFRIIDHEMLEKFPIKYAFDIDGAMLKGYIIIHQKGMKWINNICGEAGIELIQWKGRKVEIGWRTYFWLTANGLSLADFMNL